MLDTPPPGYNTNDINTQQVNKFSIPGQQGGSAQGYLGQLQEQSRSSFNLPSSYNVPSSINTPQDWYSHPGQIPGQMPGQDQQGNPVAAMIKALMGGE